MKMYLDCVQCIPRQAMQALRFSGVDEETQRRLLRRTLEILLESDWDCSPMEMATPVFNMLREESGIDDPYAAVKAESNEEALAHTEHVLEKIGESNDPIKVALKAAIGGNIIDYGALSSFDLDETMDEVFSRHFAIDDEKALISAIANANSIAYLGDNAGEIVFDKILLETVEKIYGEKEIVFVVRDKPFLNDALKADAEAIGLAGMESVEVLEMPPRIPESGTPAFQVWDRVSKCDVIISKGQGNYEAFSSVEGIFFLLMTKCDLIARDINERISGADLGIGDMILWHGDGS